METIEFDPCNPICVKCGKAFIPTKRKQGGGRYQIYCSKECSQKAWLNKNKDKRIVSVKKYDSKPCNKEKRKGYSRKQRLIKYGLTDEGFSAQLERQDFRCLGCLTPIDRLTARIDHDHKVAEGSFRGLLCDNCNWGLGHLKDNPETLYRLAQYLRYDRTKFNVYIIGSLRNERVVEVAEAVRSLGYEAFDEWISAGPEADDYFQKYEERRGASFAQALKSAPAQHTFHFDKAHLDLSDAGILVMPAGKSAHLELGYMAGSGKYTAILMDGEPERFDIMPQFANCGVHYQLESLLEELKIKGNTWYQKTTSTQNTISASTSNPSTSLPRTS